VDKNLSWHSLAALVAILTLPAMGFSDPSPAQINASSDGLPASPTHVRVAAISFVPDKFGLESNVRQLQQAFREAKAGGAEIAVAPEGVLEGYVVDQIIAGHTPAERMRRVALPVDSPVIKSFQQLAKQLQMCLVFGFAEKIGSDVYNTAIFIDGQGSICGQHHKVLLAEGYSDSWWFDRLGQQCRAFDTPFGRCGMLICNDRWNPAPAKILALDGAQFLLIPSYGSRSRAQDETVLSRGRENSIPVVEANVGVTLIVDRDRIAEVNRQEVGITYGWIDIPPARTADLAARDQVERDFLAWRPDEMKRRLEKRLAEVATKKPLARDQATP
jgi:N-carbamoylputrescine amidase